ncbi:MAG: LacI family DNA-binding transcriptional regulator [Tepidisphaeraceae bacterium]
MSIVEIAKLAGVSTATVSRIINGLPGASSKTIARVQAIIKDTKYRPLRVHNKRERPRLASKGLLGDIAVVTIGNEQAGWLKLPTFASVLNGISNGAAQHNTSLAFIDIYDDGELSPALKTAKIRGAIAFVSGDLSTEYVRQTIRSLSKKMPVVWAMGSEVAGSGVDHVAPNNFGVGQIACRHLLDLGCKRLAFMTHGPQWPIMRSRFWGFSNSAFDEGLYVSAYLDGTDDKLREIYGPRTFLAPELTELVDRLAQNSEFPDGLFVSTDFLAAQIHPMLTKKGIRVGKDLHIISCDNATNHLARMQPRPATIDIGAQEIGFRAFSRLVNRIECTGWAAVTHSSLAAIGLALTTRCVQTVRPKSTPE